MKNVILIVSLILSIQLMSQTTKNETLVVFHTTKGDITAMLYNDTPLHHDNFIKLINEGWYDDSPFHRVINNFMIQGGHNKDGRVDPGYTIPAEILPNHKHKKGALAAARMGDQVNPEKRSSGCQFYIVQNENGTPHLDGNYTVFGEVLDGFDVIDKIAAVQTGRGDVPVVPVTMTIEILE
jgi:peptidyl-prolyl cis-trans isomerase B (cyclophilin B)